MSPFRFLPQAFALALLLAASITSHAFADTPIGAKASYVEGASVYISIMDGKTNKISVGSQFREGDRIKTSANGVVEVLFDNGDLIRIDRNTDMVIKALHKKPAGSSFSIFGLFFGRVKSAVAKLATADSKFEYHTKAAIAGVGGTPPFVVEFRDNKANVDLLGEKGERGSVYVKAFDPAQTMIVVLSGHRTEVKFGSAPAAPVVISTERRQLLNRTIPFVTPPKPSESGKVEPAPVSKPEEKAKEPEKEKEVKDSQDKGVKKDEKPVVTTEVETPKVVTPAIPNGFTGSAENIVLNNISRSVSLPKVTNPDDARGTSAVENQTTNDQGVIGQQTSTTGAAKPPVSTATINVHINLK